MKSYSETDLFTGGELRILNRTCSIISLLPNELGDAPIRCHEVVRIVMGIIDVGVIVDGKYGPVDHSWIVLNRFRILDPYVVGRAPQVQIISTELTLGSMYRPGRRRQDIHEEGVDFWIGKLREAGLCETQSAKGDDRRRRLRPRSRRGEDEGSRSSLPHRPDGRGDAREVRGGPLPLAARNRSVEARRASLMPQPSFPDQPTVDLRTRITAKAFDVLDILSEEHGIPMNVLVDTAIRELVTKYVIDRKDLTFLAGQNPVRMKQHNQAIAAIWK